MTKRNKKKLKKRHKRQLMKRLKPIKIEVVSTVKPVFKYEEQNKLYKMELDKKYNGTVTALERYINQRATLLHHCSKCNTEFYGKPSFMLGKDHQLHNCSKPYGDRFGERLFYAGVSRHKRKKKSTDKGKLFYNLVIEDYTPKEIAKELDIPLAMVKDYFVAEGLI
jgi:hypothetical protein